MLISIFCPLRAIHFAIEFLKRHGTFLKLLGFRLATLQYYLVNISLNWKITERHGNVKNAKARFTDATA